MRAAGRRRRQRGAAGAVVYVLVSSMYLVCTMYIVHLSGMSILNRPFIDHVEVAKTNIDAAAAKNAWDPSGGSRTAPGVPRRPRLAL